MPCVGAQSGFDTSLLYDLACCRRPVSVAHLDVTAQDVGVRWTGRHQGRTGVVPVLRDGAVIGVVGSAGVGEGPHADVLDYVVPECGVAGPFVQVEADGGVVVVDVVALHDGSGARRQVVQAAAVVEDLLHGTVGGHAAEAVKEHAAMYRAIREGDPEAAAEAAMVHLDNALRGNRCRPGGADAPTATTTRQSRGGACPRVNHHPPGRPGRAVVAPAVNRHQSALTR
ncbi:FCD domain-containing protein [Streptomyces sp. 6N106]|uniref:FCD domain-containing protein n=1 Tax=Streptomyces sp. 6N106 TaxID=3457418 RepID=UPI003FD2DEA4